MSHELSNPMRWFSAILIVGVWPMSLFAAPASTQTQPATKPSPSISLSQTTEEGKRLIVGTVTAAGKPLENAVVSFFVRRSLGDLLLGTENTLDDGTAAIAYPDTLVGNPPGELRVVAVTGDSTGFGAARVEAVLPAFATRDSEPQARRALWAPQAPVGLIIAVLGVFAAAWAAFGYVVVQLVRIKKGARS